MKTSLYVIVLIACFVTIVGCSPKDPATIAAAREGVLLINNGVEPEGLDPQITTGVAEHRLTSAMFDGLVDRDPGTLKIRPGVAENVSLSKGKLVYTFNIRKNAKWSNGDPTTAHDFVYSWKRILSPALGSKYAYMLHCIKNAKDYNDGKLEDFSLVGVRAVDNYTLEVTLNNPTPYFLAMQIHNSYFPVHKATIEKFGAIDELATQWTRPGNMVSNGAFKLETWQPNRVIKVVKNENYWNADNVKLNAIEFFPIVDEQTEERTFRTDGLHMTATVPLNKIPVYQEQNPELIHIYPYLGSYYYRLNVTKAPLNDRKVRMALVMSIDRVAIVEKILRGGQEPAYFYTPPNIAGYTCKSPVEYNIEKAKELLAEAGYPNGEGLPTIEILYNTLESHKIIAEAIQQMWKKNLNIDVALLNQDWNVYLSTMDRLDYDIARSGWIGDIDDPINFLECFTTGNGNNRTGYSSIVFDRLILMARQATDPELRIALLGQAENILMHDLPFVPIYFYTRMYLKVPELKGVEKNQLGYISFKDLYFDLET